MHTSSSNDVDLQLSSYDYDLPDHLIAARPVAGRHHSKLLVYDQKNDQIIHTTFLEIDKYLPKDSLLVLNNSKVFPCRLIGNKKSGGQCEVFFLTQSANENGAYECLIKARGKKNIGDQFLFSDNLTLEIKALGDGTFYVDSSVEDLASYLEQNAKIPIPPYIRGGESDEKDKADYQTVYAKTVGSVAAPTAGLHFSKEIFEKLETRGINRAFVTLHVGMGTFSPVKSEVILDHKMHYESFHVESDDLLKIKSNKQIFAVGTTSLRVLESICDKSIEANKSYQTNIFLHPGIEVKSIDGLVTNFHLPKSSLIMLVSSIIGREKTMQLYHEAIKNEYRFFSYGDGMLILRDRTKND